jgi:hypothetical protein
VSSNLQDSVVLITSSIPNVDDFGTGFVLHRDEQGAYVLTCAHVVRVVGGLEKVKVGGIPAVVVASGSEDRIDLAVLRVEGLLDKPSLYLCAIGEKNKAFRTAGFQLYGKRFMIRPLHGILGEQVGVETRGQTMRTKAWDLKITDEYLLQPGYSGSPVLDEASGYVMGVVSDRQGEGKKGLAISIEALEETWQDRPAAIKIDGKVSLEAGGREQNSSQQSDHPKARVFISTLSDVSAERNLLEKIIRELDLGGRPTPEVLDWHTYVTPWIGRSLKDIFDHLPIEGRDIFIGILWHRFSIPSIGNRSETGKEFRGGTQEEFSLAYQLLLRRGQPQILIYRSERRFSPNQIDTDQLERVKLFFSEFAAGLVHPGLLRPPYKQTGEFERLVREDLKALLLKDSSQSNVSSLQKFSSESELSAGPKSWARPFVELTTGEEQDLSRWFRPEPPELLSTSVGELVEDPQTHPLLPPGVSSRARNRLRPERPPKKLFGRQKLLEEGRRYLLNDELPLLVYGIPGIGKTTFLATLFSDPEVTKEYGKENILWINIRESGASTLIEIVDEIAKGLSYPEVLNEKMELPKLRALEAALLSDLPQHIIVFDNVDLKERQVALIRHFQKEVSSRIVVGSRARFALPDARVIRLRELAPKDAIDAFKSYARPTTDDDERQSYARLTADDDERIGTICGLIGYHPQAIMIAASAMYENRLSLEELAWKLTVKRWELMSQGPEDDFEFNMRISFGVSYDSLSSASERHVFDVCGAFAASGAPLLAIAAASGLLEFDCRDLLARMQSRSLLERDERNPDHYRMHQLLHDFAREKLKEHEKLMRQEGVHFNDTPKGRMVSFYVKYSKEHKEDFPALETARDNLIQASQWALENESWEAVHDLWEALVQPRGSSAGV